MQDFASTQNSYVQKALKLASDQFPSIENQGKSWRLLTTWLAIAFIARAVIALGGNFVLHPDEIMQYLEPAHKAVFGYGVTYWEYYYGARSWIVPGFVASILWLHDLVGLDKPIIYVYVVKLVFCAISLLIPWGLYHFTRRLAGENAGRIALIMGCLWPYLVVFAHKPFTEFVATTLFFGALGMASRPFADTKKGAIALGSLLALIVAVRMHYLPAAGLLFLVRALKWDFSKMSYCVIAGTISIFFVGVLEYLTWGLAFHSYYSNFVFNQLFDESRQAQDWYFYIPRLLFVSAGGVFMFVAWVYAKPRACVMITAIFISLLVMHSVQVHKELRFLFLLQVLWMIPTASIISMMTYKIPTSVITRWVAMANAVICLLIVSGSVPDKWLHIGNSAERGEVDYLFGQSNMFDVYLELSSEKNVRAVGHLPDPYFNTPGFYYLHKEVPFYDGHSLQKALLAAQEIDPKIESNINGLYRLVTHIVGLKNKMPRIDSFSIVPRIGEYQVLFSSAPRKIVKLKSINPVLVSDGLKEYYEEKIQPIDEAPEFPAIIKP